MFESKEKPLLPKKDFFKRIVRNLIAATILLIVSLSIGVFGYHWICGLKWVDSLLNASMILTGMGPVAVITSFWGKFFAGSYAIFSGVAFLSMASIMLGPFFHRFLHVFHLDSE